MKKQKIQYKRFSRETLGLFRFNFWPLIIFEILYSFCGSTIIFPATGFILKHSLSAAGLFYITGSNISELLRHPVLWIVGLLLLLILAFYTLIEFTTLAVCFHESLAGHKVQIIPLIRSGFKRALAIFKPKNFLMILFLILIIPFMNMMVTSNFIGELTIPGFISDYIADSALLSVIFLLLVAFLAILVIRWLFVFNVFILKDQSFKSARRQSAKLIKGRFFQTLWRFLLWNLFIVAIGLLVILAFLMVCVIPASLIIERIQEMNDPSFWFTLLTSVVSIIFLLGSTILDAVITPLNFAFISKLYAAYSQADNGALDEVALVNNNMSLAPQKKHLVIAACILLVISIGVKSAQIMLAFDADTADILLSGPQVTGHRGNSTEAPENTRAALEAAITNGADYVEIDIAETKDGVLVVSHDNNLKRVSGQDIDIWNSTYDALKNIDIGSWFSPEFSGERLMTLDEAIETCRGKVKMNIELKPTSHDHEFVEKAVAVVQNQHFKDDCILASLDYPTIERVKQIDSSVRTAYISAIAYGDIDTLPVDAFSIEATFVNKTLVEAVHRQNKDIYVWTVDNEDLIDDMIDLNVDNIITDDVPLARELVKEDGVNSQDIFRKTLEQIVFGM
ncbi:glycerophosphodiester phosphodiesterase [Eubacterium sp. 1001713B170207_170306_E7]|uniref:glycerophosphodiester phosphodiesterase family protein n=1 Tax=Eubacterium sp. 1001713B170207_170306_E7 TaxID=2787097 RepID=UPI001899C330|nr:glycerophosphodiester phosphodiesterase [Eubacterium sp. 1001713B170207_170306_E7]